ncbi:MAG TPA: cytidine deaminase [Bryobacteraceae bacterium]|nr:cytidine deaminase [Bryobacteraceae bacterium]
MSTPNSVDSATRERLLQSAREAALKAYAPYSKFRVGAAVLGARDIHTGVNVENASYGLTLCAERSALSAAVVSADRPIRAVAIACIDAPPDSSPGSFMPCGACRQWLAELAPDALLLIAGTPRDYTVSELLPLPFTLE